MNIRHAYSKEDPSPDERLLWGALADDVDALALLRIGYEGSPVAQDQLDDAYNEGHEAGYEDGYNAALNEGAA
jgi:hypothetical protein